MASAAAGTAACTITPAELAEITAQDQSLPEFTWQMATSFPPIADIIVDMSFAFAEHVAAMTNGKFRIEPRLAGELAPALEVMNVVEQGAVQCGLTA
ncbi:MAG: ABC transporter substrate-binding protein, partial [Caldilineaceae bacterium SB0665_bin_21]|nr:ABC transporter substrate-binding protein [Caldilineaceae bacterium SB0665_bin_21]